MLMDEFLMEDDGSGFPAVVSTLSSLLQIEAINGDVQQILQIKQNEYQMFSLPPSTSVYHINEKPEISISYYMKRCFMYIPCSGSCYVIAYVYIIRLLERNKDLVLDGYSVHLLFFTALVLAVKFLDDYINYSNRYYAKVGGISVTKFNDLEMKMLKALDYKLFVSDDEFDEVLYSMRKFHLEAGL